VLRAFGRLLPWLLLLVAVADWVALRAGRLKHPPWLLGALVGLTVLLLVGRIAVIVGTVRGRRLARGSLLAEALLVGGVLAALGAGSANWLLGFQGFVVLHEGQGFPLHGGSGFHLQQLHTGPLARLDEMRLVTTLEELELVPAGPGMYFPRSHLLVTRGHSDAMRVVVDHESAGRVGPLRFYQGAFGFAPRIVILEGQREVFDREVPFTTERHAHGGLAFAGSFTIESERIAVGGIVDLASMDDAMRGHATLTLDVTQDAVPLGRGRLLPGHFADIERGYRVGFTGLGKWSEIDISRRNYGGLVVAGGTVAVIGAMLWPLAAWRGW